MSALCAPLLRPDRTKTFSFFFSVETDQATKEQRQGNKTWPDQISERKENKKRRERKSRLGPHKE
jgi:hypothetical protein